MHDDQSISHWIKQLQEGNDEAVEVVWQNYFDKLVRLAANKLRGIPRRSADEEDVALSAMNSFFRGAQKGRFPELENRDELWKLLVTITARKAIAQKRRHFSQKRGAGAVQGESYFAGMNDSDERNGIAMVLGSEPTPELAATMAETCQQLLDQLEDETLRSVALARMEGFSNQEIASQLDVAERTVERKLKRIRLLWSSSTVE